MYSKKGLKHSFIIIAILVTNSLFAQTSCIPTTSTTSVSTCSYTLPYVWNGTAYFNSGTYSVTLTNAGGCDSVAKLVLTVLQNTLSSTTNISICASQLPFLWNGNYYNSAGSFQVYLSSQNSCDSIATLNLTVSPSSINIQPNDTTICEGGSIKLSVSGANLTSYSWSPSSGLSNSTIQNPIASPVSTTKYILRAITIDGCIATDSIVVGVVECNKTITFCAAIAGQRLIADIKGLNYQWQINTDDGFVNISNGKLFSGVNSDTLEFPGISSINYGSQFRCLVDGSGSSVFTIKFTDTWTGAIDSSWKDFANWSCNSLPDSNTDVAIHLGKVVLDTNASVRSITVDSAASLTIKTPNKLLIVGGQPAFLLGGYPSSDSIASGNLIAYWPFEGNANDYQGGLTSVVTGNITYPPTGVRGKAYQGSIGTYASVPLPTGNAFSSLNSYTVSFWYNLPAPIQPGGQQGVFFASGNSTQGELINEFESYTPISGDSVRIHSGFWDLGSPAYQLFVPETYDVGAIGKWELFTVTYDAATSVYITYQNGVPTGAITPFSNGFSTPDSLYTDATRSTPLGNISFAPDPPTSLIIGSWPNGLFGQSSATQNFTGQLDELRVYNMALTQNEILGLYLNGKAGR